MTTSEKYVTAAYLVLFAAVLLYVLILATKLTRLEREVGELVRLAREHSATGSERKEVVVG